MLGVVILDIFVDVPAIWLGLVILFCISDVLYVLKCASIILYFFFNLYSKNSDDTCKINNVCGDEE